jgi:hypothetical protein
MTRPGWRVTQAKLRITFQAEAKRNREKTIMVTLGFPNRSNLRDQTRRHELIAEKYLERWELLAL